MFGNPLEPGSAAAFTSRGDQAGRNGKYSQAIEFYNQAIQTDPTYFDAYDGRGWALFHMAQYQRALLDFDRAIAIGPGGDAYYHRGLAYLALKDYRRALTAFDDLIRYRQGRVSAGSARHEDLRYYLYRGVSYAALSDHENAMTDFRRAETLSSGIDMYDRALYFHMADSLMSQGQYADALNRFEWAMRADDDQDYAPLVVQSVLQSKLEQAKRLVSEYGAS